MADEPRSWRQTAWGRAILTTVWLAAAGLFIALVLRSESLGTISWMALDAVLPIVIGIGIFSRRSPIWHLPKVVAIIVGVILLIVAVGAVWTGLWLVWFTCIFQWPK